MAVTLDAQTLHVLSFTEQFTPVVAQWDAWEDEAYTRKMKHYGLIKVWTMRCYEQAVTWANSVANHLEGISDSGDTIAFVADIGSIAGGKLHNVTSTNVKVLQVRVVYETVISGADYREFSVTIQAVS